MSDLLSVGASGVRAYQTALTTVSENIANAGTAGYVRRSATVREVVSAGGLTTGTVNGMGSIVSGITRAGDAFTSANVRSASSDLARADTGVAWLQRIDTALTGNQLGDRLTSFFTATRAVAADPSATAPRATMLEAASGVAAAFANTGDALDAAASDLDASADASVSQLNASAAALARINSSLSKSAPGTSANAALLDQRDQLLESMSAVTDVSVSFDSFGRATVRAGSGGPTLVQGDSAATVTYVRDGANASFAAHFGGETLALSPGGGVLAGVGEAAQRIAAAHDSLDTMAQQFVDGVNAAQAQGSDLDGNPGAPMFAVGDPPSDVALVMSDPRGIAAAGAGGSVRDNSNLARFDALRTSGNFETRTTDLIATNGAALSARQTVRDAQSAIRDNAVSARDGATGVNIDEEAVDLMRFQQAYQASSRVIQVARETLQSILDIR